MQRIINSKKSFITILAVTLAVILLIIFISCLFPKHVSANSHHFVYTSIEIEEGDTLWGLAEKYAPEDWSLRQYINEVKKLNHYYSDTIYAGDYFLLPMVSDISE